MALRDYQQNAHDAAIDWLRSSVEPCLIEAITAAGKSHIIAAIAETLHNISGGKHILCLAPNAELVKQNREKYLATGNPASVFSASAGRKCLRHPVVFGTPGTVKNRISRFGEQFALVIIDECHGITPTIKLIIERMQAKNPNLRVLGLTSTPYRLGSGYIYALDEDGKPMGEEACRDPYFKKKIYTITGYELIERGYITPPLIGSINEDGYNTLDMQLNGRGQFDKADVDRAYHGQGRKTAAIIADIVKQSKNRNGVMIFAATVQHAKECMASLPPELSAIVTAETTMQERQRLVKKFKAQQIKYMANVAVFCLDEETEILTREGWVGIDGMDYSKKIACWDIKDSSITFSEPKFIVKRDKLPGERMVQYTDGHHNFRVTDRHRMIIAKGANRYWAESLAGDIIGDTKRTMPVNGFAKPELIVIPKEDTNPKKIAARIRSLSYVYRKKGIDEKLAREKAEEYILWKENLQYTQPHELSLDDCRFIGFWLGDGTRNKAKSGGERFGASQSMVNQNIIDWFEDVLGNINIQYSRHIKKKNGDMSADAVIWDFPLGLGGDGQGSRMGIFRLEPYLNKKGVDYYWGLDANQYEALIEGLWYADGRHGNEKFGEFKKRNVIVGIQLELFDLLQCIGSCRGFKVSISKACKPTKSHYKQLYRLSWQKIGHQHFTKGIKEDLNAPEKERVWCVTSDTSYIVTRRKGKVLVTGNTTGFDAPHVDVIAILRATESVGLLQQIIGRGLRLFDGKTDCLVLDYAENLERHCPDGDIFSPEVRTSFRGEDKGNLTCECPVCGVENTFSKRENKDGFEVNQFGNFVDLDGNEIQTEFGPMPAHYGRRCQGMHKAPGGRLDQCGYRWTFKECPHCDTENDIAAKYCSQCRGEIVDPNEKLKIEFRQLKRDPTRIQTDEVVEMSCINSLSRAGNPCIRVEFTTPYRSFTIWLSEKFKHATNLFNEATENGAAKPQSVTYKKDPDSGFYRVLAYNQPVDVDESDGNIYSAG